MDNLPDKIVLTDDISSCKDFECVNCDYATNNNDKAIAHQKETKHEMWVKRKV